MVNYFYGALIIVMLLGVICTRAFLFGVDSCKQSALTKTVKTQEKRNEILNNRPDDDTFFNQLLNDPDW